MAVHGRPLPIITQNEETRLFELDEDALASVLLRPDVAEGLVCVLAVAGAFRKGKTFLLDFLLRYCTNMGSANWMGDPTSALEGFTWRQGYRRETTGILIWSEPFIMRRDNGDKVAVILMDTQGTFDFESSLKDSVVVFALSLLASSVLVYNLMSNIQEDDLMNLQTFIAYGTQALNGYDDSKVYQKLMFLVRDWGSSAQLSYGSEGGQRLLREMLQAKPALPPPNQELRTDLRRCFEDIACYLMPHPGFKAQENENFRGRLFELKEDFVYHLKKLGPLLLAPGNLVVKKLGGHTLTARDLFTNLKSFVEVFKNPDLPAPKTLAESMAQANSQTALAAGMELYTRGMQAFLAENLASDVGELETQHERMKEEALTLYQQRNNLGRRNVRIFQEFRVQLGNSINALYNSEYKPLGSSRCALKAAKQQYTVAMGALAAEGGSVPQMDELRAKHEAEKERAILCYQQKNVTGKNNEAIYEKYLELLVKEITELYDFELMPRSSSRAALLACKKRYVETMERLFLDEASTPTVALLKVRHRDQCKEAVADYQLRNELARKNPQIFGEYQSLLETDLDRLYTAAYAPRASSQGALHVAKGRYEQAMAVVFGDNKPALDMEKLRAKHEAEKQRCVQYYERENKLADNNQAMQAMYRERLEKEVDSLYNTEYKPLVSSRCAMEAAKKQYTNAMGVAAGTKGPVLNMDVLKAKHDVEKQQAVQCYNENNAFGKNNEAIAKKYLEHLMEAIEKVFDEDLMARSSSQAAMQACRRRYVEAMDGFCDAGLSVAQLRTHHGREKEKAVEDYQARNGLGMKNSATYTQFLTSLKMEIDKAFEGEYLPRASSLEAAEDSRQRYVAAMVRHVADNEKGVDPDDLKAAHDTESQNAVSYYLSENKIGAKNPTVLKERQKLLEQELEQIFQASLKLNAAKREREESKTQAKWNALYKGALFIAGTACATAISPQAGAALVAAAPNYLVPDDCAEEEKKVSTARNDYENQSRKALFKDLFDSIKNKANTGQNENTDDSDIL